jgi:hypothetical protein
MKAPVHTYKSIFYRATQRDHSQVLPACETLIIVFDTLNKRL